MALFHLPGGNPGRFVDIGISSVKSPNRHGWWGRRQWGGWSCCLPACLPRGRGLAGRPKAVKVGLLLTFLCLPATGQGIRDGPAALPTSWDGQQKSTLAGRSAKPTKKVAALGNSPYDATDTQYVALPLAR